MLLCVDNVHAHYGKSHILQGVTFSMGEGEIVSLIGRNGSGRSTTLKAMIGLLTPTSGSVMLNDCQLVGLRLFEIVRNGLAYVPEERLVFANLTVEENLRMGEQKALGGVKRWSIEEMYAWFPPLAERRRINAGSLSGGEQQMLTICRSLLGNPRAILIDEPTEGLAPRVVETVMEAILAIHKAGVSVLLVEQKLTIALRVSRRVLVMGHGKIVYEGSPQELMERDDIRHDWLEVG
ncbi:MAG: ABC transporter ATP-binding protein [Rhizobiaceae bacterium]